MKVLVHYYVYDATQFSGLLKDTIAELKTEKFTSVKSIVEDGINYRITTEKETVSFDVKSTKLEIV